MLTVTASSVGRNPLAIAIAYCYSYCYCLLLLLLLTVTASSAGRNPLAIATAYCYCYCFLLLPLLTAIATAYCLRWRSSCFGLACHSRMVQLELRKKTHSNKRDLESICLRTFWHAGRVSDLTPNCRGCNSQA